MKTRSALTFALMGMVAAFVALFFLDACKPPGLPARSRESIRAAVQVASVALLELDGECAKLVRERADRELGEQCEAVYRDVRATLVAAGTVVDAWESVSDKDSHRCAVFNAARELAALARELIGKGARPAPALEDAVRLAELVGFDCAVTEGGAS